MLRNDWAFKTLLEIFMQSGFFYCDANYAIKGASINSYIHGIFATKWGLVADIGENVIFNCEKWKHIFNKNNY